MVEGGTRGGEARVTDASASTPESTPALVRRVYRFLEDGDLDSAFELAADGFVLDYSRSLSLQRGVHTGRGACQRFYAQFRDAWSELRWELHEVREAAPGIVVVDVTFHARGEGSGVETTARGGHLWRIEDGRGLEWRLFQTPADAAAAADELAPPGSG